MALPNRIGKLAHQGEFLLQGKLSTGLFVDTGSTWGCNNEATASQLSVSKRTLNQLHRASDRRSRDSGPLLIVGVWMRFVSRFEVCGRVALLSDSDSLRCVQSTKFPNCLQITTSQTGCTLSSTAGGNHGD